MFVYERFLTEEDKALYEKVFRVEHDDRRYYPWVIDRDRQIYIRPTGKYGPETPVFFEMCYKGILCIFAIYEIYEPYKEFDIFVPGELESCLQGIEQAVREAAGAISGAESTPESLCDHKARFFVDDFFLPLRYNFTQRMQESISEKAEGSV